AKYGVNMLRIHAIDGRWAPLIDYSQGDSRHFNPKMLDRLDFLVAELKRRGIYVYFDMLDYRRFMPADGVADAAKLEHGWHNSIKGVSCYNDRMIELQKEFAEEFFTHLNPYTGLRYVDDPAVAVLEITNENSLFYFHNTTLTLPRYVDELRTRWNQWLIEQYGDRDGLARAWTNADGRCALLADEDPARSSVFLPMKHLYQDPAGVDFVGQRSPARVDAMVRFFFDLQRRYYREMRGRLEEIGVRVPVTGTNQTFCPASNFADSVNDFMSRNNYWCHPNVHAKPFFTFRNLAMVNSDIPSTSNPVVEIASSTVAGKPMIVPEFNFPWPIEHRAEGLLLVTAYACLQDWDGLLFFTYNPQRKTLEWFGNQSDPVRWGEFPAAALMFHRNDVAAARNTVHVAYSESDVFTAGPSHGRAKSSPYRYLSYISKVRNTYFQETYTGDADMVVVPGRKREASYANAPRALFLADHAGDKTDPLRDYRLFAEAAKRWGLLDFDDVASLETRYTSDTGQLALDRSPGLFTVNTPRTQAAVGFLAAAGPVELGSITVDCTTGFAAVVATSLDAKPLAASKRILITAVARAENTGQAFSNNKRSVPQRGRPPVIVEPVRANVSIALSGPAVVYALDETGKRRTELTVTSEAGMLRLRLDEAKSPWCEVVVE
ncbi:MAG: beta-galactosidase, partial [Planctomycetes bacterium]|nr:beta-galactosidase [Planctomycetota bacterium]